MDLQKILSNIPNSVSGDGKTFVAALKNYLSKYGAVTDEKINEALEDLTKKPDHVTSITLLELHAITDGVRSNNIQVAWEITPVEDYAKAEVWYKTSGDDEAWQKAGEANGTVYVLQGAETGETYYIRVVAVNGKGNAADFDTAPQASIEIRGSQYIPKAPTQFVLTWDEQGPLWQWLFEDNNYVDFFELRLDQNPGVWSDKRLDSTRETWSRADPGVRAGIAYLYIRNIFGEYSEPAVHQFNKGQPGKPSAPVLRSTLDGVQIKMEPLPQGSTKYKLLIKTVDSSETNVGYFETVNSEYIYFFFTGTITVKYQFIDPLGGGEWSDEVTATVKAGVDISQIPTIGYDKVTDDIKNAIDIANKQPDINKLLDGSITNINTNITNINTDISDLQLNVIDIDGSIANIENNIKDVTANISGIHDSINNITDNIVSIEGNINTINTDITGIENNITDITAKITDIDSVIDGLDVDSVNATLAELNKQMQSNTSSVQQNADSIAAVVTRVSTVEGEVEKQGTAINQTADSITSLAKRVTVNEGKIDTNMSAINQTADSITSLVARVDGTESDIDTLAQAVTTTATAVQQTAESVTSIAKRVINAENGMEEHTSSIQQNAESITALVKRVTTNEGKISTNESAIQQNADGITALVTRVDSAEDTIEKQGTALQQTADSITALAKRVTTNEGKISTNESAIQQNADGITALVTRVDSAEDTIEKQGTALQQTADSITALAKRVTTNEGKISTNESAIQQNADGITALVTRVDSAEDTIEKQGTALQQTADSITALAKRVTTNEGKISTNESAIQQNADGITALVTRVDSAEDTIEKQGTALQQTADSITALAKRVTTNEGKISTNESAIQQNADGITALVTRVDSAEDTIEKQGTALQQTADSITALAKRVTTNEGKISTNESAIQQNADGITALVTRVDSAESNINSLAKVTTTTATAVQQNADSITAIAKRVINTENGMEEHTSSIQQNAESITALVKRVTTNEGKISTNESAIQQNADGITALVTRVDSAESNINSLAKVTTTTATAVQQNADSITAIAKRVINTENGMEEHTSSIQQNADSIAAVVTRVSTVEGTVTAQGTAINQTADSITSVVTELNKDPADCNYSAISQLQDNILLSVKKDDVINAINISKEGIVIDGDKIHITGDTVFDKNVIVGGAIVADSIAMEHLKVNSVSTAKIQANAITSDKIKAGAITADKIEAGAIEAKHLAADSVGADAIQAGSIIGDKIAANTITGSKLAASNIELMGALTITGGNVKLSEEGLRLTGGDGSFTLFDAEGINYIDKSGIAYAQVKKMIIGKAYDGQYIKFAAPWAKPPTVLLAPMSIQVNDANYSTASLFLVCEATDVSTNGFRVNNYLRLSSDSYNVISIEKTDSSTSYTIEEMKQYWYGHYSYAYTFQCYSDVMKVTIPETCRYVEFSLQLIIKNPFSVTHPDSDSDRWYTYNSDISVKYPGANSGWTMLDSDKRTIIAQLIVGDEVLQEITFSTSDKTTSIVKNFLLSSSFTAGSTQAIVRIRWKYNLKTGEHGSWNTLYNGRDYIAKAACKCDLKRTYYKYSASEAKIARGYAVFLVTDGSTNTYITETIVKVLIKYDDVPLSNATILVSGTSYTTSGDGYIEMSGSTATKYTFAYNTAPPIDATVVFTDGVITTVNIAPANITCYIRVKYDDAIVANAAVKINGEEKTTDADGKIAIAGLDKHSSEYTVSYKEDATIVTVNYVDGRITTVELYSLRDGSKSWTYQEVSGKTIDFTVPSGAHNIKIDAEVDYAEGEPDIDVEVAIINSANNIVWGSGYSYTNGEGENQEHKDMAEIVAVTPRKTYSLTFNCWGTSGVTFSWGRDIDKLTATVTDT